MVTDDLTIVMDVPNKDKDKKGDKSAPSSISKQIKQLKKKSGQIDANEMKTIANELVEIFPDLEKIMKNRKQEGTMKEILKKPNEDDIILDQFMHNGINYYKDKFLGIWDENADLVGSIRGYDEHGVEICEMFDRAFDSVEVEPGLAIDGLILGSTRTCVGKKTK